MPTAKGMTLPTWNSARRLGPALLALAFLAAAAPWGRTAAWAAPDAPKFGPIIEGYAKYDPQDECKPKPKPGVVAFKNLVLDEYPDTGAGSISRACSIGGTSEHKEGRAWDWGVNATKPAQKAMASDLLDWLFAPDKYGHKHAMARRLGIMYLIWNRRIWGAWGPGWETYCVQKGDKCKDPDSGVVLNPHRDHMHLSFSWKAAHKNTTFWNPEQSFES